MKTVLVTGGIGSGKSSVCALLRERGVPVYDADSRTKALYDSSPGLLDRMEDALGLPLRGEGGLLDRKALSAVIFSDTVARRTVEDVVYPAVLDDFRRWRSTFADAPFVVLESAVALSHPLFDGVFDAVVLVDAPEELRIARVMRRDGLSRAEVLGRMAAQELPFHRADIVLTNVEDRNALSDEVTRVFFVENSYLCGILNNAQ